MTDRRLIKSLAGIIWVSLWFIFMPEVLAASYEFVGLQIVSGEPAEAVRVQPLAIVLDSSAQPYTGLSSIQQDTLQGQFVYQTKVKVKGKTYHRLALGNFASTADAKAALTKLKPVFVDAWIYQRSNT